VSQFYFDWRNRQVASSHGDKAKARAGAELRRKVPPIPGISVRRSATPRRRQRVRSFLPSP